MENRTPRPIGTGSPPARRSLLLLAVLTLVASTTVVVLAPPVAAQGGWTTADTPATAPDEPSEVPSQEAPGGPLPGRPSGSGDLSATAEEAMADDGLPPGIETSEKPASRAAAEAMIAASGLGEPDDDLDAPSAGGSISGTVTAGGNPVEDVLVLVWDPAAEDVAGIEFTDAAGAYTVGDLGFGSYEVGFYPIPPLAWEWYNNVHLLGSANQVLVPSSAVTGIDAALEMEGSISGTVTAGGNPVAGVVVLPIDGSGNVATDFLTGDPYGAVTNASGQYTIVGLTPATYRLRFLAPDGSGLLDEFFNGVLDYANATGVVVASGASVTGRNATLDDGGSISGNVVNAFGHPLPFTAVWLVDPTTVSLIEVAFVDLAGNYVFDPVPPGAYLVYAEPFEEYFGYEVRGAPFGGTYQAEFHLDAADPGSALEVPVVGSGDVGGIDFELAKRPTGLLRATTNPALPVDILVDGIARDAWGLTWPDIATGEHVVCFESMPGWVTPDCQIVTVTAGQTTTVQGDYVQRGFLRVLTNPALPATVSVEGVDMNEWGMWTDLDPGTYEVCFGAVAGFAPPPCQDAVVTSGNTTVVTGNYVADGVSPGPAGDFGYLRATTNPAVGTKIIIDSVNGDGIPGTERDSWGLTWLKLPVGFHQVCFGSLPGLIAPPCEVVEITSGATTEVVGDYTAEGFLRVLTSPAVPVWVSVDGFVANAWGVWRSLPAGDHLVCFGPIGGLTAPACQTVTVTAGAQTTVTGTYT